MEINCEREQPCGCVYNYNDIGEVVRTHNPLHDRLADARREIDGLFTALRDHYLAGIDCNEENHTDKAACSCGLMMSTPRPSIGQAVQQWIDHVRDVTEGRWTQQGALDALRKLKTP